MSLCLKEIVFVEKKIKPISPTILVKWYIRNNLDYMADAWRQQFLPEWLVVLSVAPFNILFCTCTYTLMTKQKLKKRIIVSCWHFELSRMTSHWNVTILANHIMNNNSIFYEIYWTCILGSLFYQTSCSSFGDRHWQRCGNRLW